MYIRITLLGDYFSLHQAFNGSVRIRVIYDNGPIYLNGPEKHFALRIHNAV